MSEEADDLFDILGEFFYDPLGYVLFAFPWDSEPSIQVCKLQEPYKSRYDCVWGPDLWACEFLDDLGDEIKKRDFDGSAPVDPIRFATVSGHGIGKSALVAWLIKFILDTRPLSKGTVTANTAEQLKTKTWAELGKWHAMSLTAKYFKYSAGRGSMSLVHNALPAKWRCDAQTSREENSESFAGQHAATATSFYIFDEASAVPDKIFEVREGGTVLGEPMVFDFGNGTRNSGTFFEECVGRQKHRYNVRSIDSRSVSITNKKRIQEWIDDYGVDSDFVKVRVRGMFPSQGNKQFIPTHTVDRATQRELVRDDSAQLLIGVDVARFGDDESVIYPRIGDDARSFEPRRFRGLDTVQLLGQVIEVLRYFKQLGKPCAGLFVDGAGVGGGLVDQLRHLGYNPIEVQAAGSATDTAYRAKGDEMWGKMRDHIATRLLLPELQTAAGSDLRNDLTQREFEYTLSGRISLETKRDMKERGIPSPNLADALALTYAFEVAPILATHGNQNRVNDKYDPYDVDRLLGTETPPKQQPDPFPVGR